MKALARSIDAPGELFEPDRGVHEVAKHGFAGIEFSRAAGVDGFVEKGRRVMPLAE